MSTDTPFDRRTRRLRRDRAARMGFEGFLHHLMANELVERLDLVRRQFRRALDLGCADGYLTARLRARGMTVVPADSGRRFALAAGGVQCDEDRLPFADASFELVVSVGTLDSVNDLPGALTLIRRSLAPDGLFLAVFAGAGSLKRLKRAMLAADEAQDGAAAAHVHPQIDVRAAGDLLQRAGFALPVADSQSLSVRFGSLGRLAADLRAMGAGNALSAIRPLGRAGLAAAASNFMIGADPDGRAAEQFEMIHLSGWAPSPDQPKPAKRGSATASLANALRRSGG